MRGDGDAFEVEAVRGKGEEEGELKRRERRRQRGSSSPVWSLSLSLSLIQVFNGKHENTHTHTHTLSVPYPCACRLLLLSPALSPSHSFTQHYVLSATLIHSPTIFSAVEPSPHKSLVYLHVSPTPHHPAPRCLYHHASEKRADSPNHAGQTRRRPPQATMVPRCRTGGFSASACWNRLSMEPPIFANRSPIERATSSPAFSISDLPSCLLCWAAISFSSLSSGMRGDAAAGVAGSTLLPGFAAAGAGGGAAERVGGGGAALRATRFGGVAGATRGADAAFSFSAASPRNRAGSTFCDRASRRLMTGESAHVMCCSDLTYGLTTWSILRSTLAMLHGTRRSQPRHPTQPHATGRCRARSPCAAPVALPQGREARRPQPLASARGTNTGCRKRGLAGAARYRTVHRAACAT